MAHLRSFFFLIFILFISGMAEQQVNSGEGKPTLIEVSCKTTHYPALCIKYLSTISKSSDIKTPQQLAQAALTVSLYRARYTRSYMSQVANQLNKVKTRDYQLVKDCLDQINDSINQLSQSIRELHGLGGLGGEAAAKGDDIFWHLSNVDTWISSALTDASTCIDEFPNNNMSKLKATIKGKVLNVAQTASNALALFQQYAARYTATTSTHEPKA